MESKFGGLSTTWAIVHERNPTEFRPTAGSRYVIVFIVCLRISEISAQSTRMLGM